MGEEIPSWRLGCPTGWPWAKEGTGGTNGSRSIETRNEEATI